MDPYAQQSETSPLLYQALSLSLSEKKMNRDMLSAVLSSDSLHDLQYRYFSGKPLYKGKGDLFPN